jgi:hypothetical protein
MSVSQLQAKALDEWSCSKTLQRQYHTPEFYWWKCYQRIYCPDCRARYWLDSLLMKVTQRI